MRQEAAAARERGQPALAHLGGSSAVGRRRGSTNGTARAGPLPLAATASKLLTEAGTGASASAAAAETAAARGTRRSGARPGACDLRLHAAPRPFRFHSRGFAASAFFTTPRCLVHVVVFVVFPFFADAGLAALPLLLGTAWDSTPPRPSCAFQSDTATGEGSGCGGAPLLLVRIVVAQLQV